MPLNSRGQVIVNPSVPLGMSDFAQMYIRDDPSQYPSAAQDYIASQWDQLGISQSPQQYFANQRQAAPTQPTPTTNAAGPQIPTQWPTFQNDNQRTLAIAAGTYHAQDTTPTGYLISQLGDQQNQKDIAAAQAYAAQTNPVSTSSTPQQILTAQQSGDEYGDTHRVLQSLQNTAYDKSNPDNVGGNLNQGGSFDSNGIWRANQPYQPTGGYGAPPSDEAMQSKLDLGLVNDPTFRAVQAKDPNRAAFVYQHLTGRDLQGDTKQHQAMIDYQTKTARDYTQDQLSRGAKFDMRTGQWSAVNKLPQDQTTATPGLNSGASLQYHTATPEEANWFQQGYTAVTGRPNPQVDPQLDAINKNILQMPLDRQTTIQNAIKVFEQGKGAPATPQELTQLIPKALAEAQTLPQRIGSAYTQAIANPTGAFTAKAHPNVFQHGFPTLTPATNNPSATILPSIKSVFTDPMMEAAASGAIPYSAPH